MKICYLVLLLFIFQHNCFAQVTLKGTVKNTKDSFLVFVKNGIHAITRESSNKRYKARIDKSGGFEITLPEDNIGHWMLESDSHLQFFYLIKGQSINLVADFSKPSPLTAFGSNSNEFNYVSFSSKKMNEKYYSRNSYWGSIRTKNVDSALQIRKDIAAYEQQLLDEYIKLYPISETYYKWLKAKYTYAPYQRTINDNLDYRNKISSDIGKLLAPSNINDDYAALNSVEYNEIVEFYTHYMFNGLKDPRIMDYFEFGSGSLLQGLTKQVFLTRRMILASAGSDGTYESIYNKYDSLVTNTTLTDLVKNARNKYHAKLAAATLSTENISKSKSLNEIFGKYKGKVIYVDFWASWCAPCLGEMSNAANLKKQLKGQEVVIVYLAFNDQKAGWLAARKEFEIEGEHYLLSASLMKEATEVFGIYGVPHYAIIDKDGNIFSSNAERPLEAYPDLLKLIEGN
jgi:thiol-disulfide isomerase/thioredoxin